MIMIYLVEQHYQAPNFRRTIEALRAFDKLATAQDFCKGRANVQRWKAHDSHGRSWESLDGDGVYSIAEIELDMRPAIVPSNIRLFASLEGMSGTPDKRVAHHALADVYIEHQEQHVAFTVPTAFVAYGLRIRQMPIEPSDVEQRLARMIVDSIPREVWDACVAALQADCEKSVDTVFDILQYSTSFI